MNETILIWSWVITGWVGGLLLVPREAFRTSPVSAALSILMFGGYVGPFVFASRAARDRYIGPRG